jgi:hypothetical protein
MLCYADVVKVIRDVKDDNLSISNSFNKITDIERRTFKKVLTYNLSLYFTMYAYYYLLHLHIFKGKKNYIFDLIIIVI